jgi:hypothetical protein
VIIAEGFFKKRKKAQFSFFNPCCLPLQTSVAEDSRSSGKSRGDEAIQSAGKKESTLYRNWIQ